MAKKFHSGKIECFVIDTIVTSVVSKERGGRYEFDMCQKKSVSSSQLRRVCVIVLKSLSPGFWETGRARNVVRPRSLR